MSAVLAKQIKIFQNKILESLKVSRINTEKALQLLIILWNYNIQSLLLKCFIRFIFLVIEECNTFPPFTSQHLERHLSLK